MRVEPPPEPSASRTGRARRISPKLLLLPWFAGFAFLVFLGIVAWKMEGPVNQVPRDKPVRGTATDALSRQVNSAQTTPAGLTDSPDALWARPEFGEPIDLRFMPRGVQGIVRLRLAELIAHPQGERILRSLGPETEDSLQRWFRQVGVDGASLRTLTIALLPQGTVWPETILVAELAAGTEVTTLEPYGELTAERIARSGKHAFWFPEGHDRTFAFGPFDLVNELRMQGNANPLLLRRELEQLRQATHDTDHVTILANPNFLRDEAQGLFAGSRRRLLDGLYDFWSDHAQAISLGFQLRDVAVAELRMIVREDWLPQRLSTHVRRRIEGLPSRVSDHLGHVQLDPYWQPLALRFPAMLRFTAAQTRIAVEGRQVAVSTALPVEAVHNLLLAAELTLASPLGGVLTTQPDRTDWTVQDVLAFPITVRIAQQSLEFALRDVARQVQDELEGLSFQFAIEIIGTDLQLEGITRNQQIRDFTQTDRPLADILTALVMQANPVRVTRAADPQQKLVWLVAPSEAPRILITTRSAAARENWDLPPSFLDEGSREK